MGGATKVGTDGRGARWRTALAMLSVLAVLIGCDALREARRESRTDPTPAVTVGTSAHAITVDGKRRTFLLHRPASLSLSTPVPLVVMLHGALGSGGQAESSYGWNAAAEQHGFVVAYPDGLTRSWAVSDGCCGPSARRDIDDVTFIGAMVADISGKLPVDSTRIYAAGMSNGGMLAYRLACDTTIFAAVGSVAGKLLGSCPSPEPISVIHIHGTADDIVPYDGGPGKLDDGGQGLFSVKIDGGPVPDQIDRWRRVAGCADPEVRTSGPVTTSASTCPDGRGVALVTIAGAGHQWPGAEPNPAERLLGLDDPSRAMDATESIWRFFDTHPRSHEG